MEMRLEADDLRRSHVILRELQLVLVDRVDRQHIVMRLVALRRAHAAKTVEARNCCGSG